jgi:hypothetical protein
MPEARERATHRVKTVERPFLEALSPFDFRSGSSMMARPMLDSLLEVVPRWTF